MAQAKLPTMPCVAYRQGQATAAICEKSGDKTMRYHGYLFRCFLLFWILACENFPAVAQGELTAEVTTEIDKIAADALAKTGVPSASIAVVKTSRIVYVKAYGNARLEPRTPAVPEMRYSIGSISKQFTSAAILLLQEQGKLSLDDKVAKFIPSL